MSALVTMVAVVVSAPTARAPSPAAVGRVSNSTPMAGDVMVRHTTQSNLSLALFCVLVGGRVTFFWCIWFNYTVGLTNQTINYACI